MSGDVYTAVQIQSDIPRLDVRGLDLPSKGLLNRASQFCAEQRVDARLRYWWAEPKSRYLWIQEPPGARSTSPTSTAVFLAAQRAKTPVIRFSCVDECGIGASMLTPLDLVA